MKCLLEQAGLRCLICEKFREEGKLALISSINITITPSLRKEPLQMTSQQASMDAQWNRYLATLNKKDREAVVKSRRETAIFNRPACYWPSAKTHPKFKIGVGEK